MRSRTKTRKSRRRLTPFPSYKRYIAKIREPSKEKREKWPKERKEKIPKKTNRMFRIGFSLPFGAKALVNPL